MHLLILPGSSKKNQTWGELVCEQYGPRFTSVHVAGYEHWAHGTPTIDFTVELQNLRDRQNVLFDDLSLVVMAKSAGALLAFIGVTDGIIQPRACIFFGIPFDLAAEGVFKSDWSLVQNFSVPSLAFHNEHDPTADYRYTVATIAQYVPHIKLVTTEGDDHWYGDFTTYDTHIIPFLTSQFGAKG